MQPKPLTIAQIAERLSDDPNAGRNLARKIGYNLSNPKKADSWASVGIENPGEILAGKNDPFIAQFVDVIKSVSVPKGVTTANGLYYAALVAGGTTAPVSDDHSTRAAGDSETAVIDRRSESQLEKFRAGEVVQVKVEPRPTPEVPGESATYKELKLYLESVPSSTPGYWDVAARYQSARDAIRQVKVEPKKTVPARPLSKPRGGDPKSEKTNRPLSDRMSPDVAFYGIIFVVLIADAISAGLIYFVGLSEYPDVIRYSGTVGFSVVGFVVGYSALLNYLSINDSETGNLYAFGFAAWQIALHTAAVFSFIQFGQVVVYLGAALATVATIAAIKSR